MDAGAATGAWYEVGPLIGDLAATGLELSRGVLLRDAIAAYPRPRRQIQPSVARLEEQLDQQAAERLQEREQGLLEVEERGGPRVLQAIRDDLVEPLMGLLPEGFEVRWTGGRGRVNLVIALGGGLLIVPFGTVDQRSGYVP